MALRLMEVAGSWAHPPEGILDHIFSRLPSFADRASCTGVCKLWRSFAREEESTAPPLLPCLLRPSTSGASCFHFFSRTSTDRPTVPAAHFCGSMAGGWFVVARDQWRGYALLHLASGRQIPLPQGLREDGVPFTDLMVGLRPVALVIRAATVFPAPANNNNNNPDDGEGRYVVAAITLGHHKAAVWQSGMERWLPLEPDQGLFGPALDLDEEGDRNPIMSEELEDVIYHSSETHEGFYFLTSEEHLMVFGFHPEPDDDEDEPITGELDCYLFPGETMAPPPEAGHVVAARYLVELEGRLLMVKRFVVSVSPGQGQGQGTVSFQIFTLEWDGGGLGGPRWERTPPSSAALTGKMLFVGRGCSRAIRTGRSGPAFIYFLDDADGSPEELLSTIVSTDKKYRCSDMGWCRYHPQPQYVGKSWPRGPPADCSPWMWLYDH